MIYKRQRRSTALLALGREIHLVDLENLLGYAEFTATDVGTLRPEYERSSGLTRGAAHVVVATSSYETVVEAGLGWAGSRPVFRPGKDGADHALLAVASENLSRRYARLVIGSGDHAFAPLAATFLAAGHEVTVVTRRCALSMELRLAVKDVRYLPEAPALERRNLLPARLRAAAVRSLGLAA